MALFRAGVGIGLKFALPLRWGVSCTFLRQVGVFASRKFGYDDERNADLLKNDLQIQLLFFFRSWSRALNL